MIDQNILKRFFTNLNIEPVELTDTILLDLMFIYNHEYYWKGITSQDRAGLIECVIEDLSHEVEKDPELRWKVEEVFKGVE